MVNVLPREVAGTPAQTSQTQTLSWGLDCSRAGWKVKSEKCRVQRLGKTWCVSGSDLPLCVLPRDSSIHPAAPAMLVEAMVYAVAGSPALTGCWEGGEVQWGRMPRASHSPTPGQALAFLGCFPCVSIHWSHWLAAGRCGLHPRSRHLAAAWSARQPRAIPVPHCAPPLSPKIC